MEIHLPYHRRARVWFDERPARLTGVPIRLEESEPGGLIPVRGAAAVELLVPRGASVQYGLLGATFVRGGSPHLDVLASISDPQEARLSRYTDSLVGVIDDPVVGLPSSLAQGALAGMLSGRGSEKLVAGSFTFDCAAFGDISSSPAHFGTLAAVLVELLILPDCSSPSIEGMLVDILGGRVNG